MLTISASISYDSRGNILHKGDRVLAPIPVSDTFSEFSVGTDMTDTLVEAEIYDILVGNRIAVVHPEDKTLVVMDSGSTTKVDKLVQVVEHFEGDQIGRMNEESELGRARLMSPKDELLNEVADILLDLMKSVKKVVMATAYNIKKMESVVTARTGRVMEGKVEAEIHVADMMMKRKSKLYVELLVREGTVQTPFGFRTSDGKQFPFNEAGIRKHLNIPLEPYIGKKPSGAVMSYRKD